MYQSLALAPSPGPAAYADSGSFLRAPGAGAPVFVPPARVASAVPYLPACEPGPQPPALAAHPGWAQAASADSPAFGAGSPPPPPAAQLSGATAFPFAHSPPGPGGGAGGRDGRAYEGALRTREQFPGALGRPGGGAYPATYPAYLSAEMAPAWASGPFQGRILHGLQGRRATLGECGAGGGSTDLGPGCCAFPGANPHPTKCVAFLAWGRPARGRRNPGDRAVPAAASPGERKTPRPAFLLHIRRKRIDFCFPSSEPNLAFWLVPAQSLRAKRLYKKFCK